MHAAHRRFAPVNSFHALKDRIAIVGVGNTPYGNFPEIDDYGLGARAFRSQHGQPG
jgi:hypothetical protein